MLIPRWLWFLLIVDALFAGYVISRIRVQQDDVPISAERLFR